MWRPPFPSPRAGAAALSGVVLVAHVVAACTGDARADGAPEPFEGRRPAPTMSWRGADWLLRDTRVTQEDPEAMLDALGVEPGDVVADIGAGVGFHSLRLAERVGPGGKVFATDLQPEMLERLRRRARSAGITNVETVQATQVSTGLPPNAVDLALMVDVYHELADPRAVLADLVRALRPGGRLALVEFRAEDPTVPIRRGHKMSAAQMLRELRAVGWTLSRRFDELPWQHLMLFGPPSRTTPSAASPASNGVSDSRRPD